MRDEQVNEQATTLGAEVFGPRLSAIADKHPCVGEVRGLGAFWALELVTNRETREPLAPYGSSSPAMAEILAACKEGGVLPFANFNRIHVVPPCNITVADAEAGLAAIDSALSIGDRHTT